MRKNPEKGPDKAGLSPFLAAAMLELQAQLDVCSARRAELNVGGFDKDLANASAALGRAITGLAGEQRQQEKHAKDMVARMSLSEQDALVKEYLREVQPERRTEFRALLDELDATEMVLGA